MWVVQIMPGLVIIKIAAHRLLAAMGVGHSRPPLALFCDVCSIGLCSCQLQGASGLGPG